MNGTSDIVNIHFPLKTKARSGFQLTFEKWFADLYRSTGSTVAWGTTEINRAIQKLGFIIKSFGHFLYFSFEKCLVFSVRYFWIFTSVEFLGRAPTIKTRRFVGITWQNRETFQHRTYSQLEFPSQTFCEDLSNEVFSCDVKNQGTKEDHQF